jgi:hypothetical protein
MAALGTIRQRLAVSFPAVACYGGWSVAKGCGLDEAGRGSMQMHTDRWLYWVSVGLSGATMLLVVAYIILVQDNRSVQAEVNKRQQFINQSIQLGRINEALVRALAAAAASSKDDKLRDLLTQNGISVNAAGDVIPSANVQGASSTSTAPGTSR